MQPIRFAALIVVSLSVCVLCADPGDAATTMTQTKSVQATTNFSQSLAFNRFDPALGTLTGVTYSLTAGLADVIGLESLDPTPTTLTGTDVATVTLKRPDGTSLAAGQPGDTRHFAASAFDGAIDFGGTSGITFNGMGSPIYAPVESVTDTYASDLALFSGMGSVSLPVTAVATSSASGSGNVVSEFQTEALASVTVFYTYDPALNVAEPGTLGLLAAGTVGLFAFRRPRARAHASR